MAKLTQDATSIRPEVLAGYEPVIGLEVHAQLKTATKAFCACSTRFGDPPNTNTCPVCLGLPGALPVLNRRAVELGMRAALALHLNVQESSRFARKNYFYPDLPKGYQISMYELPLATAGWLEIEHDGQTKRIGITRLHLEDDAAKNLHEGFPDSDEKSYVDYNRGGTPLAEIVSEPDLRSPAEAHAYLTALKQVLLYTEVSDCNMEEGSLRCDANVSVRRRGAEKFGTKAEVKNLNSFRHLQHALEYEIERQISVLEAGGKIDQETRLWNVGAGRTEPMRSKEFAHDYRYFPEPDLLPLVVDGTWVDEIRATLPELPAPRRERFAREYQLSTYDADVLTQRKDVADYFEAGVAAGAGAKEMANWVMTELLRMVREEKLDRQLVIHEWPLAPTQLARLVLLVQKGTVNRSTAKALIPKLRGTTRDPEELVVAEGLAQVSDRGALEAAVAEVITKNAAQVAEFRAGKERVLGFLVGQVMKATGGKANPKLVQELLTAALRA